MTCPDCERYKQSAAMWRNKAYELGGNPLPWEPEELLRKEYERGYADAKKALNSTTSMSPTPPKALQPEQEPFGYFRYDMRLDAWVMNREGQRPGTPFYTAPPKRTWIGLTMEEVQEILNDPRFQMKPLIVHAVETKLKEKNT